jgi:hypothetical protein
MSRERWGLFTHPFGKRFDSPKHLNTLKAQPLMMYRNNDLQASSGFPQPRWQAMFDPRKRMR